MRGPSSAHVRSTGAAASARGRSAARVAGLTALYLAVIAGLLGVGFLAGSRVIAGVVGQPAITPARGSESAATTGSAQPRASQSPAAAIAATISAGGAGEGSETDTGSVDASESVHHGAYVVCIDPGHQTHSDQKIERIGPGSKKWAPRATGGTTGISTGMPEYEVALELSVQLTAELESRGVKVVLTRTRNDVRLSNAERAHVANRAHADLFIRVHCGASTIATDSGCRTSYPAPNRWTSDVADKSRRAAVAIQKATVAATHAADRGACRRGDIVGFNWSKAPSVMVEPGYLSNTTEDTLLADRAYQDKVARGIAEGVMRYLDGAR